MTYEETRLDYNVLPITGAGDEDGYELTISGKWGKHFYVIDHYPLPDWNDRFFYDNEPEDYLEVLYSKYKGEKHFRGHLRELKKYLREYLAAVKKTRDKYGF